MNYFEQEIYNLIQTHGSNNQSEQFAQELVSNLKSVPDNLTKENIESVCKILLKVGRPDLICELVFSFIKDETFPIPWPYFLEAFKQSIGELGEKLIANLHDGIIETGAQLEAARSKSLDQVFPDMLDWKQERKIKIQLGYAEKREQLMQHVQELRSQELFSQENELLAKLVRLFPNDEEIKRVVADQKERKAYDIIARIGPIKESIISQDMLIDPESEKIIKVVLKSAKKFIYSNPELAYDFVLMAIFWEAYEDAFDLLLFVDKEHDSKLWIYLELLLLTRRYLELLTELTRVESKYNQEPDIFLASSYLRAQAYWGLGQKALAIEVMESIINMNPHYRSSVSILESWKKL